MSPDQSNSDPSLGSADSQRPQSDAAGQCAICGSTESLSTCSFDEATGGHSQVTLCAQHYRVTAILSGDDHLDPADSLEYDLQETGKITVRVPKALIDGADSVAEQQGQTRSEFVRDAIETAIQLQELDGAVDETLTQALDAQETEAEGADVEFLKNRIRKLESLLEDSIGKI